jgi:hypothetical protein
MIYMGGKLDPMGPLYTLYKFVKVRCFPCRGLHIPRTNAASCVSITKFIFIWNFFHLLESKLELP